LFRPGNVPVLTERAFEIASAETDGQDPSPGEVVKERFFFDRIDCHSCDGGGMNRIDSVFRTDAAAAEAFFPRRKPASVRTEAAYKDSGVIIFTVKPGIITLLGRHEQPP